jgi:DNA-binding transcriptional MerR regulator
LQSEILDLARRLEQQLTVYAQLHASELGKIQEQLEQCRRLQNEELQMLRDELKQLKEECARLETEPAARITEPAPSQAPRRIELTITRRDLLTGNLPPFNQKHVQS